jgi:hypothetical protein
MGKAADELIGVSGKPGETKALDLGGRYIVDAAHVRVSGGRFQGSGSGTDAPA